jgi:type VI secretion system secreted protein Hcp
MAEHIYLELHLTKNGARQSEVQGESTVTSHGRENKIECLAYEQAGGVPFEASTGRSSGRRQYSPIVIRKRIDGASPLLWKAMTENAEIEGIFRMYRPHPDGASATQNFCTVTIKGGRIVHIKQTIADTLVPTKSSEAPLEEVAMTFGEIEWEVTPKSGGAKMHHDKWGEQSA